MEQISLRLYENMWNSQHLVEIFLKVTNTVESNSEFSIF